MKKHSSFHQRSTGIKQTPKFGKILLLSICASVVLLFACVAPSHSNHAVWGQAAQDVFAQTIPAHWDPYQVIEKATYTEHRLIVGFDKESDLERLIQDLGATRISTIPQIRAALLEIPHTVSSTLDQLRHTRPKGIRYVSPNYRSRMDSLPVLPSLYSETGMSSSDQGLSARTNPNDPLFAFQWSHGVIDSHAAWEEGLKGQGVIVAVFDTGVDGSHPDLDGQLVTGWGWDEEEGKPFLIEPEESRDRNGHGTHVSGIIAAIKDNSIGIAGLAPLSRIMPVPSLDLEAFAKAQGVVWAVENGAQIIQNSWGFIYGGYIDVLKDAYDFAMQQDTLVVFASANAHVAENWSSPRSWPGIMVVGASDIHDQVTTFSNGSAALSVVAPGRQVLSTVNMYNSGAIVDPDPGKYAYYHGTSMAAPHVSALAAILWEKHPTASAYQIRRLIEESAFSIEPPHWSQEVKGHNPWTGYGRIDVAEALRIPLPQETPGNLKVRSVNESGQPTDHFFYVTLARTDGTNYWSRTELQGGVCHFRSIDPGIYDIYIGEAPREDGKPSMAFRFFNIPVDQDTVLEVVFP